MLMTATSAQRSRQRWLTMLVILCLHAAVLWLLRPAGSQRHIDMVHYLQTFNVSPAATLPPSNQARQPLPPLSPRIGYRERTTDTENADIAAQNPINTGPSTSSSPVTADSPGLDLDALRHQAVQTELKRPKSEVEKMNDGRKLNLSMDAKIDRELNQLVLPECRVALLGKSMPERMMIIQNHNREKFCR